MGGFGGSGLGNYSNGNAGQPVFKPMATTLGAPGGGPGGGGGPSLQKGGGPTLTGPSPQINYNPAYNPAPAPAAPAAPSGPTATQALSSVATAAPNPAQQQSQQGVQNALGTQDPLLAENIQNIRDRLSTDTTGRAIDASNSGISDTLAGAVQRAREAAARSGTAGNTAPQVGALEETAQRAKAGAGAQIALGRQGQLDQLALGANAAFTNPSNRNLSLMGLQQSGANAIAGNQQNSLSLALQAWQAQQNVDLQRQQQAQQAAQAQQAQALSLYNSLWS